MSSAIFVHGSADQLQAEAVGPLGQARPATCGDRGGRRGLRTRGAGHAAQLRNSPFGLGPFLAPAPRARPLCSAGRRLAPPPPQAAHRRSGGGARSENAAASEHDAHSRRAASRTESAATPTRRASGRARTPRGTTANTKRKKGRPPGLPRKMHEPAQRTSRRRRRRRAAERVARAGCAPGCSPGGIRAPPQPPCSGTQNRPLFQTNAVERRTDPCSKPAFAAPAAATPLPPPASEAARTPPRTWCRPPAG